MAWNTILAGMKLTPTRLNQLYATLAAYKAADTSRTSNATLTSDPDLTVSVEANATYLVDLAAITNFDPTPDFKFSWTGPSGATMINWAARWRNPDGTEVSGIEATLTTVVSITTGSAASNQPLWCKGVLVTSSTAGTFAMQWAQVTSSGNATIVRGGSSLHLKRIA